MATPQRVFLDEKRNRLQRAALRVIARDGVENASTRAITSEAWENKDAHSAALQLPSVQAAIAQGRPLIAGMPTRVETTPVG